jgi:uncharacterized protein
MDSETQGTQTVPEDHTTAAPAETSMGSLDAAPAAIPPPPPVAEPLETRILLKILMGPQGLRAGWSIAAFILVSLILMGALAAVFVKLHLIDPDPKAQHFGPVSMIWGELFQVLAITGAAAVVALIERRRGNLMAYNLTGPHRVSYFFQGLIAGFLSLSALVGAMAWGHWLTFGPVALSGSAIFTNAALWGIGFLLVGCFEEGTSRCFLQFTFTRGLNFWVALGIVGAVCGLKLLLGHGHSGNGNLGVYILAGLGLIPCFLLQLNKSESSGFWQASWVTTTLFGLAHTGNNGENWIGIFAAGAIGFVFVVSIRVTGSAWWAIGCHAAWDWAETYFYGAIDSGNVATGHYLTVNPAGNVLWSGGSDGPEGSLLVVGIIVLMVIALVAIYGRRKPASATELAAG